MKLLSILAAAAVASSLVSALQQTDTVTPYDKYILAPASRDILPSSISATTGDVTLDASNSLGVTLSGDGSTVTFDFGQQVAGFITLEFGASTTSGAQVGVAFTENAEYIGTVSDNSTDMAIADGTIYATAEPAGSFTFGREFARGSYRYLTLSTSETNTSVQVTGVSSHFTAVPKTDADKLRDYSGYFYSDDDLLNRVWYAGAYTIQLCTIASNESRANPPTITSYGWFNNATISGVDTGAEVFVDGAKRDRTPWAGDYGVSVLSKTVSWNSDNLLSLRNAIVSLYSIQDSDGQFAYAGSPIAPRIQLANINSNTYHLWTLITLVDYAELSGDTALVKSLWSQAMLGFEFILANFDDTVSLLNITAVNDWGRVGQSGKTIVGNTLLYHALNIYADIADELTLDGASYNGTSFADLATSIKASVNTNLWDATNGLFYDNTTAAGHELYPQDGNSLAVHFNITETSVQASAISTALATRWNDYGAVSPEGAGSISPFVTSFEVDAHLLANPGNASRALELVRRQWGYMLNEFSNSTLVEGYYHTGELYYPFYGDGEGAYISHAHAWSTGPVASLTLRIGGLSPISDAGKTWTFQPHAAGAGVSTVDTGYTLETGAFSVEWTTNSGSKNTFFQADIVTPTSTTGTISVPTFGKSLSTIQVSINGKTVWKRGRSTSTNFGAVTATEHYVTVSSVGGGWFNIVAKTAA